MAAMHRLSPSDFAFLWEQCKRCYYLKVVRGIRQPSMPMAGIFKKLEGLQMAVYEGRRTTDVLPSLPPGSFRCGEKVVESEPVAVEGGHAWYIYGKTDSLIEFDDGSWGILDFKTTTISPEKGVLYGRQLHAYLHAFGHPAAKPQISKGPPPRLEPISKLGLLCFEPSVLSIDSPGRQAYHGDVQWIEIPKDPPAFLKFVDEAVKMLGGPTPAPTPGCDWCSYALTMRTSSFDAPGQPAPAAVLCPQCNAPMKQRNGKYGAFWGCTRYPECRGTRQA